MSKRIEKLNKSVISAQEFANVGGNRSLVSGAVSNPKGYARFCRKSGV